MSNLIPMKTMLLDSAKRGFAVPSFCVWNAEAMTVVLRAAAECRSPVILMNGPCEFVALRPAALAECARALVRDCPVPVALHLDHADSIELVQECLDAGYTSVMLDYSAKPYAENTAALRETVKRARKTGATVEGEIGHVGRVDNVTAEGAGPSTLTVPSEAASYTAETGVDALAVSIGNAHGLYTRLPQFDFDRLLEIHKAVRVPLVLHGGSGTPEADIKRAISLGMAKVNVATELIAAFRESLRSQWNAGRNLWLPLAQAEAMENMGQVVRKWISLTGAAGKA